jgi:hypothetical protein
MNGFIQKNKILRRVPWEIAAALVFNALILGLFLLFKSPPPQPIAPSEITVDVSDFAPPEVKAMTVPETLATGGAASELTLANPEKLTESTMRDFSPQLTGNASTAAVEVANSKIQINRPISPLLKITSYIIEDFDYHSTSREAQHEYHVFHCR